MLSAQLWAADYTLTVIDPPTLPDPTVIGTGLTVVKDGITQNGKIGLNVVYPELNNEKRAGFWNEADGSRAIGTLGGTSSTVNDINEQGQLVGQSASSDDEGRLHAFLWTPAEGLLDLGSPGYKSEAFAVNELGQVVGAIEDAEGRSRAFSWTADGGMIELDLLGAQSASAFNVDNNGRVIGQLVFDDICQRFVHIFSWSAEEGMIDRGDIEGGDHTVITASTDSGQIVGHSVLNDGSVRAFFFTADGVTIDLGTLGGLTSHATDVSVSGQVVGFSDTARGGMRAYSWTLADGMLELGDLGGNYSAAVAVNKAGQVVGTSLDGDGLKRAFVWNVQSGMVDLNDVVVAGRQNGLILEEASEIGADGSIVAYGRFPGSSQLTWVLLKPDAPDLPDDPDADAADLDNDGVADAADLCPGTVLGVKPLIGATKNRFYSAGNGTFLDGRGTISEITVADTGGCSGQQIIALARLGSSNERYGVWERHLVDWAVSINLPTEFDTDSDGVADAVDMCPGTVLGVKPTIQATKNRFYATVEGAFVDGRGTISAVTVSDAGGCSGQQIIAMSGLGSSNERYGVWERFLVDWVDYVDG